MNVDPRYIALNYLQQYFVDKDTGMPLAAGVVTFYKDEARTELKTIYQISGSPPNYSYVALPNPMTLSSVGTFMDNTGNDITVYAFPYDDNGDVELYYITVYSAGAVLQFTREGVPGVANIEESSAQLINYIPNGQFLLHTDLPDDGLISTTETVVAPGGVFYKIATASVTEDYLTFTRFGSYVDVPSASPRYALDVHSVNPNPPDDIKALTFRFKDVNKFASTTQYYTFAFTASNLNSTGTSVDVKVYKYYGSGGSAATSATVGTFIITPGYRIYSTPFIFGTNSTKSIGVNNDDYVEIQISFPTGYAFNIGFTDFILTIGNVNINDFPVTTTEEFSYRSGAGSLPVPAYNGSDYYLPLMSTPSGYQFDRSIIGKIFPTVAAPGIGELLCDGAQYSTTGKSSELIPYSRLQSILWNNTHYLPIFGTGRDFFTAVPNMVANSFTIVTNSAGVVSHASDGTPATGFNFTDAVAGSTGYFLKSYLTAADTLISEATVSGVVTDAVDVNTGFTISIAQWGTTPFPAAGQLYGSIYLPQKTQIKTVAAAGLGGKYFNINMLNNSNVDTAYYVWFNVSGSDPDPAPSGRIGIKVGLHSAWNAATVAEVLREALNGWDVEFLTTVSGAVVPAGSYFNIYSTTTHYYVWYKVDAAGTDPAPAGATGILVSILHTDSSTDVAVKTIIAINQTNFAVPDLRGQSLMMVDGGAGVDLDTLTRWSMVPGIIGDVIGTYQSSNNLSHSHISVADVYGLQNNYLSWTDHSFSGGGAGDFGVTNNPLIANDTSYVGARTSRPNNVYVNFVIKY